MCVAVGSTQRAGGHPAGALIELWNGSAWSLQAPPRATGAALSGVSCPSATICMAVGTIGGGQSMSSIVEIWDGTAWSRLSDPNPAGVTGTLAAVSCASASECMAVGSIDNAAGTVVSQLWNGTTWTAEPVPNPAPGGPHGNVAQPTTNLAGVSCSPDGACGAVGGWTAYGDDDEQLVADWNGTAWSIQTRPSPGKHYTNVFNGVSCTAASACEAVGTAALNWNGQTWSPQALPLPSGSSLEGSDLAGDSCTAANACVGVGGSTANSGKPAAIVADTYDGTGWTAASVPAPPGGTEAQLAGVSCWSATACIAVGSDDDAAGISVRWQSATTAAAGRCSRSRAWARHSRRAR